MEQISGALVALRQAVENARMEVQVVNQPSVAIEAAMTAMANSIETTFMPVVAAMNKKIDLDLNILHRVNEMTDSFERFREASNDQAPGDSQ